MFGLGYLVFFIGIKEKLYFECPRLLEECFLCCHCSPCQTTTTTTKTLVEKKKEGTEKEQQSKGSVRRWVFLREYLKEEGKVLEGKSGCSANVSVLEHLGSKGVINSTLCPGTAKWASRCGLPVSRPRGCRGGRGSRGRGSILGTQQSVTVPLQTLPDY